MCVSHGPCAPTSQTTAILGLPLGVGREEAHTGQLSDARALGPRLREDDGQGNWSLLSVCKPVARLDNEKPR